MTNAEIIALNERYLFATYARAPMALVRGQGCRVWDADGKEYLDFFASTVVTALGHCHPSVTHAIVEQAEKAGRPARWSPLTFGTAGRDRKRLPRP